MREYLYRKCPGEQIMREDNMEIILASASPRRKDLLEQIGLTFRVCVSDVEERFTKTLPWEVVEELSLQKAEDVFEKIYHRASQKEACMVIGADTVVACDGKILGKPASEEEAVKMLTLLQGRSHFVYTGVTLIFGDSDGRVKIQTFHEETKVTFYPMSEKEIRDYVSTKDPMDKAGSYGIQGLCARYISGICGDYNNVVGLPVGRIYQYWSKMI